jgi:hypothetical protein
MVEDLLIFLQDFGVSCTAGAVTGLGILDMPSQVLSGDMILTTDYTLTVRAADFGNLLNGSLMSVDGVPYQVREVRRIDDGQFCEIGLQKVSGDDGIQTDLTLDGGTASSAATVVSDSGIYDGGAA